LNDSALFFLGAALHRKSLGASLRRLASKLDDALEYASNRRSGASLFDEFGVTPGKNLNLGVASAANNRSYITYVFKDAQGNIVYVGRASGPGTPRQVMAGRLRKGHEHFHEGLTEEIVDVQKSKMASQGAEEVFIQGYRERGAVLTNIDESLSFDRKSRIQRSLDKIEAYLEELAERGLR